MSFHSEFWVGASKRMKWNSNSSQIARWNVESRATCSPEMEFKVNIQILLFTFEEKSKSRSPTSHQATLCTQFHSTQIFHAKFTKKNETFSRTFLTFHLFSLVFLPFESAASLTTEESAQLPAEMWANFSRQTCMHVTNRITFFSRFVPNQTRWLSLRAKRPRKLNCVP